MSKSPITENSPLQSDLKFIIDFDSHWSKAYEKKLVDLNEYTYFIDEDIVIQIDWLCDQGQQLTSWNQISVPKFSIFRLPSTVEFIWV